MSLQAPQAPEAPGESRLPPFYEPPTSEPPTSADPELDPVGPPMGLPRRLAFLTAIMAVLLVLGATEIALSWSARTRLEDFRLESVALANTLASLLVRAAPTGNAQSLTQASRDGPASDHRIAGHGVSSLAKGTLVPAASSGTDSRSGRQDRRATVP